MFSRQTRELLCCPWLQFNALKHHLATIRAFVSLYQRASCDQLRTLLLPLGTSQMDMYTGRLSLDEIGAEVGGHLRAKALLDKTSFNKWMGEQGHFATITLSDDSRWVLRLGETEPFVHLHPGRYSPHSIRAKANPLRTAITSLIIARQQNRSIDLALVNHLRTTCLQLSPVKLLTPAGEIDRMIELVTTNGEAT